MYDAEIFGKMGYSIAPASAFYLALEKADFVTTHRAGEGAVGEACLHIIQKFFK
jgi:3-deoxy-D-manno-octulosonate 8-phosphate phosphatase (KDO 8-P phosphatase)